MCWWVDFSIHIKDTDSLRNLAVFIGQHYKAITKHDLKSILDEKKTPIPHSINHHDRPNIVAVIATILGDVTKPYPDAIKAAAALEGYDVDEKVAEKSAILAKNIITFAQEIAKAKSKKDDYDVPEKTKALIKKFAAALTVAICKYVETGPEGSFTIDYLNTELS
jgi:hypothetical protein